MTDHSDLETDIRFAADAKRYLHVLIEGLEAREKETDKILAALSKMLEKNPGEYAKVKAEYRPILRGYCSAQAISATERVLTTWKAKLY